MLLEKKNPDYYVYKDASICSFKVLIPKGNYLLDSIKMLPFNKGNIFIRYNLKNKKRRDPARDILQKKHSRQKLPKVCKKWDSAVETCLACSRNKEADVTTVRWVQELLMGSMWSLREKLESRSYKAW